MDLHAVYGGVVPEIASRDHVRRLLPLIRRVLEEAALDRCDLFCAVSDDDEDNILSALLAKKHSSTQAAVSSGLSSSAPAGRATRTPGATW